MNVKINENYARLENNYLFSEVGKRVAAYKEAHPEKKIVKLGIGDVTLPLTKSVVEAMSKAVDEMGKKETFQGYPPYFGYDFLLAVIARHYKRFGVSLSLDEIFVSDGAKSDAGNITEIFGNAPVLIVDPVYPVYIDSNVMAGREIRYVAATKENGFAPSPRDVKAEGAVIYLCSPNNPTGAVYDRKKLAEWVEFAKNTGSLIIFDSAYEGYIRGDYPHSIFEIDGARLCSIEICSFSKTAGFTGTRCSWTVVPNELFSRGVSINKLWARRQTTKFNGVPYIVQRGAEAALSDEGFAECLKNVDYYMENARLVSNLLDKKGIFYTGGISSPYIWMECPMRTSSWEFFDALLEKIQVVGTPGAGFGKNGEGYFRLTSFGSHEDTAEAIERLERFL